MACISEWENPSFVPFRFPALPSATGSCPGRDTTGPLAWPHHSMYDEGIVNDQFCQLQSMKESVQRDYVVRTVTCFCVACISLFATLTDQIYQQQVDFQKVHVLSHELYARTTGVGAEKMRHECAELLYACEMKDKNHCYQALYWIKNEFSYLRRKLETLVQMERRIIDLENMQRHE